jgi:hypothetical protein
MPQERAVSKTTSLAVREAEIEDVFVTYPRLLRDLMGWEYDFGLIARQMDLTSGRLDLLCTAQNKLILIELKVEPFQPPFLIQVVNYRNDLGCLQTIGKLVGGDIQAYLLVSACHPKDIELCSQQGIILKQYEPGKVLERFYHELAGVSNFLTIRPVDLGVWNIHLVNRALYALPEHNTIEKLSKAIGLSRNSVRNQLRFSEQLGLVNKLGQKLLLTDLGIAYLKERDPRLSENVLSEGQTKLLAYEIASSPFASSVIFGIFSFMESVFILARNSYPVQKKYAINFYKESVGKRHDWVTERSAFLGASAYANFAVELGLLARAGDMFSLTPSGFRFILMLQLHKGIKIVDALGLGR